MTNIQPTIVCTGVREYGDDMPVTIRRLMHHEAGFYSVGPELVVQARNEGGYNSTCVDLLQLLRFVRDNLSPVWDEIHQEKVEKDYAFEAANY